MYINEIIRITYKCNWKCKFCNVWKVNNFWEKDIESKEIVFKILSLSKRYSVEERKKLILSFSWGEPLLNKNIFNYIKLAKRVWVWIVQVQTNWSLIFKNLNFLDKLIESWLDEIFLAQHSYLKEINTKLWCFYEFDDFLNFSKYLYEKMLSIDIKLNIVITKINLPYILEFIKKLQEIWFLKYIKNYISIWFCQPNWYAYKNKNDVLLRFDNYENEIIWKVIDFCKNQNIKLDFHYTSPPLCILNNPEYNLEYKKLKQLEIDKKTKNLNNSNLESFKFLWKEKKKFENCKKCIYDKYCLWFYKNWIEFAGVDFIDNKIINFLNNQNDL